MENHPLFVILHTDGISAGSASGNSASHRGRPGGFGVFAHGPAQHEGRIRGDGPWVATRLVLLVVLGYEKTWHVSNLLDFL